jgi:hypothetical protein
MMEGGNSVNSTFLIVGFLFVTILNIVVLSKRRKQYEGVGIKGYLAPLFFYLSSLVGVAAYLFDFVSMTSWVVFFTLFGVAIYCTKYNPAPTTE